MRYGIISDIHSNLPALQAALEALSGVDAYLCLGDVVGYGAEPNHCCEIVRDLHCPTLMGNHDAGVIGELDPDWFNDLAAQALRWTARMLTAENLAFLKSLPEQHRLGGVLLVHGSPLDPWEYIYEAHGAAVVLGAIEEPVCLFGHTHLAMVFRKEEKAGGVQQTLMPEGGLIALEPGFRYLINPGSVGQPRDGNPQAACAIYDDCVHTVELLRVDYPVQQEQLGMERAGLSRALAARLEVGF
jgi:diadenosine tetraphosphatase ApaH/serine/threonine PP2A family protein phosphatase